MEEYPLSHQAKAFRAMFNKAKAALDTDRHDCYRQCMDLIQHAYLPRMYRCMTYHLLVFCAPHEQALYWVNEASTLIEEMQEIMVDDCTKFLFQKNKDIRSMVETQLAVETKDEDEGEAEELKDLQELKDPGTKLDEDKGGVVEGQAEKQEKKLPLRVLPTPPQSEL